VYAHQVVEAIYSKQGVFDNFYLSEFFKNNLSNDIKEAQKFYIGDINDYLELVKKLEGSPDLFWGPQGGGIGLPYKKTWIDFNRTGNPEPGTSKTSRGGMLLVGHSEETDIFFHVHILLH